MSKPMRLTSIRHPGIDFLDGPSKNVLAASFFALCCLDKIPGGASATNVDGYHPKVQMYIFSHQLSTNYSLLRAPFIIIAKKEPSDVLSGNTQVL